MRTCDRDLEAPWIGSGPEEEDQQPAFYCDRCGEGVYEGDPYYFISNELLCPGCHDDVYRRIA